MITYRLVVDLMFPTVIIETSQLKELMDMYQRYQGIPGLKVLKITTTTEEISLEQVV